MTREALAASLASAKASASEALCALVSDIESAKENSSSSKNNGAAASKSVGGVAARVELRILEKIVSVCEPGGGSGAAAEKRRAAV